MHLGFRSSPSLAVIGTLGFLLRGPDTARAVGWTLTLARRGVVKVIFGAKNTDI